MILELTDKKKKKKKKKKYISILWLRAVFFSYWLLFFFLCLPNAWQRFCYCCFLLLCFFWKQNNFIFFIFLCLFFFFSCKHKQLDDIRACKWQDYDVIADRIQVMSRVQSGWASLMRTLRCQLLKIHLLCYMQLWSSHLIYMQFVIRCPLTPTPLLQIGTAMCGDEYTQISVLQMRILIWVSIVCHAVLLETVKWCSRLVQLLG